MLLNQNFDNELEGLEQQYNILCETINRLREALILETDVTICVRDERRLEKAKSEREQLEWQIRQIKNRQLYPLLLKLDYTDQEQLFSRFIRRHEIGAFLIHGPSQDYGHHWLANRLLKEIRRVSDRPVLVDLDCLVYNPNPQIMWKQLGRHFGGNFYFPDAIVDKVLNAWTTKNIFIIVDNVEFMSEQLLHELISSFWEPLINQAQSFASKTNFKLLMFLIDNISQSEKQNWNLPFAEGWESSWSCNLPVKLPILKLFSDQVLRNWINSEFIHLPDQLIEDIDQSVQIILENSEAGIPIPAVQEICNLCECDWLEEWLKIC